MVIILAAGQGTRLRPFTDDLPKCLVPFLGKSLLERQLGVLKQANQQHIHIITGYCAEKIETLSTTLRFTTSRNPRFAETNMVETLFSGLKHWSENHQEDLIIAYGDIIYTLENLNALLACQDTPIALMIDRQWKDLWSLRLENPLDDAETLKVNTEGYITELGKKPNDYNDIQGQYTGLIKIRQDKIADFVTFYQQLDRSALYDGKPFDHMYMTSFLQQLIDAGWKTRAAWVNNGWLEVDSVSDLEQYETLFHQGKLNALFPLST